MERLIYRSSDPGAGRHSPSLLQSLGLIIIGILLFGILALPDYVYRSVEKSSAGQPVFNWQEVEKGYAIGRYALGQPHEVLKAEVLLVRFDLRYFTLRMITAPAAGPQKSDLRTMTLSANGLAGINANFFDAQGAPLGLIIQDGQLIHRLQHGGRLLTGVFYVAGQKPHIVHRDHFSKLDAECALQGGPLLIVDGKPMQIADPKEQSRRSGIALTNRGEVIIFATFLRFPGAALEQIQQMLLDPMLDISAALNLDGGGSSQLFVRKNPFSADDTFITGGDLVPAGLVVQKR